MTHIIHHWCWLAYVVVGTVAYRPLTPPASGEQS
jgi:hypothetical protein